MTSKFLLLLIVGMVASISVLPHPKSVSSGKGTLQIVNPCSLTFGLMNQDVEDHIQKITNFFFDATFKNSNCTPQMMRLTHAETKRFLEQSQIHVAANIASTELKVELSTSKEAYQLEITVDGQVHINTPSYQGYVRALDTLSQLIKKGENGIHQFTELPITISDEPVFEYRGIMMDTARHYLDISTIKRVIDSLTFNKLNVLHWHITDDESFPILLKSRPYITTSSAYSSDKIYTYENVADIVQYARERGVIVVPEFDTPGHTWSWSKSSQLSSITVQCGVQYGQFDPTMDLTYEVVKDVFTEFSKLFPDAPFVHFGGDEIVRSCYDKRPSIKAYMAQHGIADYDALQVFYRQKQKQIWRNQIGDKRQIAYWTNQDINLPVEDDDIIHWWGTTDQLSAIKNKKNKIILSYYDLLYLDTGFNNAFGKNYGTFSTWRSIYEKFDPQPQVSGQILGGVAPLWAETVSDQVIFFKLYTRASAFSERLWNPTQSSKEKLSDFVKRLVATEYRLTELGFNVMATTSQYCSLNVDVCYP